MVITVNHGINQDTYQAKMGEEVLLVVRYQYWPEDNEDAAADNYDNFVGTIMDLGGEILGEY